MDSQIQELKELIDKSRNTVVITEAGVSMSSGIGNVEHWNLGTVLQMSSVTLLKLAPKRYIGAFPVYAHVGQLIPEAEKARKWIELAELIIVIGANGSYYWSYGNHIKPNAKIVQINPKSTFFDNKSILNIRKKSDEVFSEL